MGRVIRPPKVFSSSWQPPAKSRRLKMNADIRWLVIGLIVVGGLFLYYSPYLSVKEINYSGDENKLARDKLNSLLDAPILSRRIGSVVSGAMSQDLSLQSVTCQRGLPHTLNCQIKQREELAMWVTGEDSYLVDENGFVFARNENESGTLVVYDQTNLPVKIGDFVLSRQVLEKYQQIVANLKAHQLSVVRLILTDATVYQVDVLIVALPEYGGTLSHELQLTLKFNLTNSLENQLSALFSTLEVHGSEITNRVDLRVAGTVYYQ